MDPANVPPLRDVRFAGWTELPPTIKQLVQLQRLLREEGVDPAELFGDGFLSLDALSRWGASWGIGFLTAAQDARYIEGTRRYIERENERVESEWLKSAMAGILREHNRA